MRVLPEKRPEIGTMPSNSKCQGFPPRGNRLISFSMAAGNAVSILQIAIQPCHRGRSRCPQTSGPCSSRCRQASGPCRLAWLYAGAPNPGGSGYAVPATPGYKIRSRRWAAGQATSSHLPLLIVALHRFVFFTVFVVGYPGALRADDESAEQIIGIKIQDLDAGIEPQFERDILPLLKRSCLACHSANTAESDVVLQSPAAMLAYDADDPLLVPGNPAAGKLLQVAAQLQEPFMPPADNDVGAKPLTPAELGQLKRWIESGAKAGGPSVAELAIEWRPMPQSHRPIMATQITERGDTCICARGPDLEIYDLLRGNLAQRLVDPAFGEMGSGFQGAAHLDVIRSLATCDDGEWIASGGFRTVKLWRHTRKSRAIDLPASGPATALAVASGRSWLATGDGDGSLSLGPLRPEADSAPASSWQAHDASIVALAFAGDGERLISVAADGLVRCWEMPSRRPRGAWKLSASPLLAEMINDEFLVTSSDDLVLRLWRLNLPTADASENTPHDAGTDQDAAQPTPGSSTTTDASAEQVAPVALEPTREFRGHGRKITSLSRVAGAEAGTGPAFLSGSRDGFLRLWDVDTGVEKRNWIHGQAIEAVAASRDGSRLVSVGEDGVVKSWRVEHDELQWAVAVDFQSSRRLVSAEQTVEIGAANLDVAKKAAEAAHQQQGTDQKNLAAAQEKLAAAEKALAAAKAAAEVAKARQTAAAEAAKKIDEMDALAKEAEKAKQAVAAAEDVRQDGENSVRRADEGEKSTRGVVDEAQAELAGAEQVLADWRRALSQLRAAPPPGTPIVSAAFSDDGGQLLLANRSGRLFLFTGDGSPIGAWQAAPQGDLSSAHFAGSDEVVALAQDPGEALVVWNTRGTWRLEQSIGGPNDPASPLVGRVLALDFSPDARLLAIGGGDASRSGQVVLWDLTENRLQCQFDRPHDDAVLGLAFSRDGQYLATSSADHMMKVFRTLDGTAVQSYEGHSHHVLDVAWRANGLQLATCSADKTIKIWDFRRGEQVHTIAGAGKEINAVEFLGIGSQLVSAAGDRTIRIHNVDDGKQVRAISAGGDYLFCCAANESGDIVVAGGADRVLRVYNSADGTERFNFPAELKSQ